MTDAVNLIKAAAPGLPSYAQSFASAQDGWILVGGPPATAQEDLYLFQTVNGGKSWSLERHTTWTKCTSSPGSCTFLDGTGELSMAFWNGQNGVITEAMMAIAEIAVYRTADGGRNWSLSVISLPHQPQTAVLTAQGASLTLTISYPGHGSNLIDRSTNGGLTWRPLNAQIPAG